MSDQEILLTTGSGCGTIKVDAHRHPHPQGKNPPRHRPVQGQESVVAESESGAGLSFMLRANTVLPGFSPPQSPSEVIHDSPSDQGPFVQESGSGNGEVHNSLLELSPKSGKRPTENLSDLEICLMLTRIFQGREDPEVAGNLYRLSRLFKANTETEEEQQDGENRPEA